MRRITFTFLIFTLFFSSFFYACRQSPARQDHAVRVRATQDPENLNPVNYNNATALEIINLVYQSLLTPDPETKELKPVLAAQLPLVQKQDSITVFSFKLRPEARWPNNQPITAADVAFTLKLYRCPLIDNDRQAARFHFIKDVVADTANPLAFNLICEKYTPEMDLMTGDFAILPAYLVDPKGLLAEFTLPQLTRQAEALSEHPKIKEFAAWFDTDKFSRDKEFVQGSGGYLLDAWKTGQYVRLTKKQNWWGENLIDTPHITAHPEKITYRIIPDNATALQALMKQDIDVYTGIPVYTYQQLRTDQNFKENFDLYAPESYDITYLGINSRLTKFKEARTRQALAYLLNVDEIIKGTMNGFATRTVGPITPTDKRYYNATLTPYTYNLEKAAKLLQEAGWVKKDNSWQKMIGGQWQPLTITLNYKAGNSEFERIALYFQEAAAKIQIPVSIQPIEGVLLNNNLKAHQFEVFIRYLMGNPFVYNFKELLHTENAAEGGANFTNFGTAESDRLIDQINCTPDLQAKAQYLSQLQEILHEQSNLIFLYVSNERIAINNRFANLKISGLKPGYDISAFTLKAQ
ncbi:ABC transporter substrate-binding protein [Adhaeribacter rhizoryzae]|uniref:ABC transporter substrate-binding protein n=1 Tax=Adhaeribacter rhizoryzae TaxID=2607907 RepID=A0A5M6DNT9_9BACT|nr:ABC transporter substrate-binding protein [Adhaeribacter rhizoryzae]KAA5549093.1 ABC transporter substrate-binding protein [Adhaeribacter rhizoryzae]